MSIAVAVSIGFKQLRHNVKAQLQRAAEHLMRRLLNLPRISRPDPVADEVIGNGDFQAILAQIEPC